MGGPILKFETLYKTGCDQHYAHGVEKKAAVFRQPAAVETIQQLGYLVYLVSPTCAVQGSEHIQVFINFLFASTISCSQVRSLFVKFSSVCVKTCLFINDQKRNNNNNNNNNNDNDNNDNDNHNHNHNHNNNNNMTAVLKTFSEVLLLFFVAKTSLLNIPCIFSLVFIS